MSVQIKQLWFTIRLELFTFLGCQHGGVCASLQSQENSEFTRTQEEVVQFNRQISKLSQAGHLRFPFPVRQHWSNFVHLHSGERAAAHVPAESPDRRRRPPLGAGQTEEHVRWSKSATRKVMHHWLTSTGNNDPCDTGWRVPLQRGGWFEEDGGRIPGIFQSDPASSVGLFSLLDRVSLLVLFLRCIAYLVY